MKLRIVKEILLKDIFKTKKNKMENFDLRKYLAEGRLLKEDVMVNPIIMFGGKKYIEDVISSPDDFGFDENDAEWVKNNILSSPKMVSIQDYMDLDDKWVKQAQIETGGGGDLDHIVDALKVHIKQGLITPEQAKEAMKVVGLTEGRLLKENLVDFEGNDMYQEIKGDMKRYYKMDVSMDVIKDWADYYFPNRKDEDGIEYEFETSAREDFLDHLEDLKDSNASDEDKELQKQIDIQAKAARRITSRTRDLAMAKGLSMDDYFDSIAEGRLLKENHPSEVFTDAELDMASEMLMNMFDKLGLGNNVEKSDALVKYINGWFETTDFTN
jgi:hypothetical protein